MSKGLKHCCYTYHRHVAIRIFSGLLIKRSYGEAVLCDPFTCPVVKIVCLSLRGPPLGFDFGARNANPHLEKSEKRIFDWNEIICKLIAAYWHYCHCQFPTIEIKTLDHLSHFSWRLSREILNYVNFEKCYEIMDKFVNDNINQAKYHYLCWHFCASVQVEGYWCNF